MRQACVVLKSSKNPKLAAKFQEYLQTEEVKKILGRFGFDAPTQAGRM
jgi:ABC-type molybdate transport system substrate-binding protein